MLTKIKTTKCFQNFERVCDCCDTVKPDIKELCAKDFKNIVPFSFDFPQHKKRLKRGMGAIVYAQQPTENTELLNPFAFDSS